MTAQKIWLTSELEVHICNHCGVAYALTVDFVEHRQDDHNTFYCPNGHQLHFPQMSDEEKLQKQLQHCRADRDFWQDGHNDEQERRMAVERSRSSLRGVITKMKKGTKSNGSSG